jgi:hypothetical protein
VRGAVEACGAADVEDPGTGSKEDSGASGGATSNDDAGASTGAEDLCPGTGTETSANVGAEIVPEVDAIVVGGAEITVGP